MKIIPNHWNPAPNLRKKFKIFFTVSYKIFLKQKIKKSYKYEVIIKRIWR